MILKMSRSEKGDYIISFAVFCQSLLSVIQLLLIYVFSYQEESTTIYRVIGSAVPMILAIVISFRRKPKLFFGTYLIVLIILVLHSLFFPENEEVLWHQSIRFLLPIVIPSALCTISVKNPVILEKTLYYIAWVVFTLLFFLLFKLFSGVFNMESYDMSLSYALLLPMMSLYRRKKWFAVCASLFILAVVIAIGSRGAAVVFLLYVLYDIIINHKKLIPFFIVGIIAIVSLLPLFADFLESYGITSRTLQLLFAKDYLHSSNREDFYSIAISLLKENPFIGIGLFGDRAFGAYVHNFILEVLLNFGVFIGTGVLVFFFCSCISAYFRSTRYGRDCLVAFFCSCFVPLIVSGSYLIDYFFGTFIGILFLSYHKKIVTSPFVEER